MNAFEGRQMWPRERRFPGGICGEREGVQVFLMGKDGAEEGAA